jgi:hypothetical protein
MKKAAFFLMALLLILPLSAAAETWKSVAVVDTMCAVKVKADPDKHPTSCALTCAKGGFGVLTADGSFLKLDEAGNEKAVAALKNTKKSDHLRATVTGERNGDTIKVESLSLD